MSHQRAHYLANVPEEQFFCVHNGSTLKNLFDLRELLRGADEESYNYHVTSEKNDFKSWISDAVKDKELANQLENGMTKDRMMEIVEARINSMEYHTPEAPKIEVCKEPMDEKIDEVLKELDKPIEPIPIAETKQQKSTGRFGYFMTGLAIGFGIGILFAYAWMKLLPKLF